MKFYPLMPSLCVVIGVFMGWVGMAGTPRLRAEETEAVLELPPFIISETAGPRWRYARIEGFEILTQATDSETREVIAGLWRGRQCLLPASLLPRFSVPMTVILFDQKPEHPAALQGLYSIRKANEVTTHWANLIKRTASERETFSMNLWEYNFQYSVDFRFDTRTLFKRRAPAVPTWLQEGLFGRYGLYREGWFWRPGQENKHVVKARWFSPEESQIAARFYLRSLQPNFDAANLDFGQFVALIPEFNELLGVEKSGSAATGETTRSPGGKAGESVEVSASIMLPKLMVTTDFHERWSSAVALFVRWGIYGRTPADAEKFWRFAERTCSEPVTEALFEECFGMSFAAARHELARFLPEAISKSISAPAEQVAPPPAFKLRAATSEEVARLRGEWERLEAWALRIHFPEIANYYRDQAARRFEVAYRNGSRDPRLLASMGLFALDNGETARARELLEAAAAKRVAGPRVYFELARLRWLETEAQGAAPSNELIAGVVDLLLMGERQAPPLAAIYGFLAAIAAQEKTMSPAHAAALERGAAYFPKELALRAQIAAALKSAKK